jgi:hypothetical protein
LPLLWCAGSAPSCTGEEFDLFELLALAPANVGRRVSADSSADQDFAEIAEQLTDGDEDVLRFRSMLVRATGGVVEGDSEAILEYEAFFPAHPTFVDFSEFIVEEIRLTLDALTLASPGTDQNGDGQWTDYSYRVTYSVTGYPLPKADCNQDGRSTLADWHYLRTHGTAPNRCMRGPTLPLPLGCECGNVDANTINEFDMDLRDFAIYQNAFAPPEE